MQKVVDNLKIFESHIAWEQVVNICQTLTQNGFEALLAGGCVRDLVMQRLPKDFDIATNATPDQILSFYPKALSVGREFGVIILAFQNFQIEIASFRKDGAYLDGRRPVQVTFTNAEEDAKRRDFSVNALFLNIANSQITDYVGGLKDLEDKIIRAVGDPYLRFSEDKLRMLRALRFSSQLNFKIEAETFKAIQKEHANITQVSAERIHDELIKWLLSSNLSQCLQGLWESQLLMSLHISFKQKFTLKHFEKCMKIFTQDLSSYQLLTKLCVLFEFLNEAPPNEQALKKTLSDLKFAGQEIASILWVLRSSLLLLQYPNLRLSEQIEMSAHSHFSALVEFIRLTHPQESVVIEKYFKELQLKYLMQGQLPAALINGENLKALGLKPGPEMGEILKETYRQQLEQKLKTFESALEFAKAQIK